MEKEIIRARCEKIFLEKNLAFSEIMTSRIHKVYAKHAEAIGSEIDYSLLTDFTSDLLSAYSGVISEILILLIQEVLADDDSDIEEID